MEFTNKFTVPTGIDEAFEILTDLERVAPCMPGATLDAVDGGKYSGRMRVKVGPVTMTYAGTATVTKADPVARTAHIEASGRESKGAGTASAEVHAQLQAQGAVTVVTVVTDINVTGKAAQFGRGVIGDVGAKVIERFADNLEALLAPQEAHISPPSEGTEAPSPKDEDTPEPSGSSAKVSSPPREDALDLVSVAAAATMKRVVPLLVLLAVIAAAVWWLFRG